MNLMNIQELYDQLNKEHFYGCLNRPTMKTTNNTRRLGQYSYIKLSITISIKFPQLTKRILLHEMVHQYIYEVLGDRTEQHGKVFKRIMNQVGIGMDRLVVNERYWCFNNKVNTFVQVKVTKKNVYRVNVETGYKQVKVCPSFLFTKEELCI